MPVKPTPVERLILMNQYRILEKLYPEDDECAGFIKALRSGFTEFYPELEEEVPTEICEEVVAVLTMYRAIERAVESLPAEDPLRRNYNARFEGFYANDAEAHFSYAQYLINRRGYWDEFKGRDLNGLRDVEKYRAMLAVWDSIEDAAKYKLSRDDLERILNARTPTVHRLK